MIIRSVDLETVCGPTSELPVNDLPEVAFAGRSNVGKSSLINTVMGRKSFARTSQKPGKTQTLNFYNINNELYLVDLPGYGYAKTSKALSEQWGTMIENYLTESEQLACVFLLVDIRNPVSELDKQMYDWINYLELQPIIIATKADKINRSQLDKHLKMVREGLGASEDDILIPFSSVTKLGLDDIYDLMEQVIE
ncbi:MAG: ribosome biogenesis GTP-binding protein YihA/YsxC [Lachnospiraceae bacterium]|nr:ribosome biogenesis GTP-binding protein YihA/YsxC [Lachnospiraceae bacterium]